MRPMMLMVALALIAPAAQGQRSATAGRDAVFIEILDNFEQAYDTHDAARFVRFFDADADFMNAFGVYRKGRPAIQEFMAGFMAHQPPGFRRTLVDRRIQLVGPDAAFVEETRDGVGIKNADGTDQPPRRGHMMLVLRGRGDSWRIVHYRFADVHTEQITR